MAIVKRWRLIGPGEDPLTARVITEDEKATMEIPALAHLARMSPLVEVGGRDVPLYCPIKRAAGDGGPDRSEHYFRPYVETREHLVGLVTFVCAFCLLQLSEDESDAWHFAVSAEA